MLRKIKQKGRKKLPAFVSFSILSVFAYRFGIGSGKITTEDSFSDVTSDSFSEAVELVLRSFSLDEVSDDVTVLEVSESSLSSERFIALTSFCSMNSEIPLPKSKI